MNWLEKRIFSFLLRNYNFNRFEMTVSKFKKYHVNAKAWQRFRFLARFSEHFIQRRIAFSFDLTDYLLCQTILNLHSHTLLSFTTFYFCTDYTEINFFVYINYNQKLQPYSYCLCLTDMSCVFALLFCSNCHFTILGHWFIVNR